MPPYNLLLEEILHFMKMSISQWFASPHKNSNTKKGEKFTPKTFFSRRNITSVLNEVLWSNNDLPGPKVMENNFLVILNEAGVTFDNSFFDNYFDFLRQLKNGSFLGPVFVHVTGQTKN